MLCKEVKEHEGKKEARSNLEMAAFEQRPV